MPVNGSRMTRSLILFQPRTHLTRARVSRTFADQIPKLLLRPGHVEMGSVRAPRQLRVYNPTSSILRGGRGEGIFRKRIRSGGTKMICIKLTRALHQGDMLIRDKILKII